ncbi:GGDEF domain-containing protein [Neobacillus notoginsengisoli]|uniref:GGDEF domain-containing protein n=1 Tax=Neobacillus notoginsengisoli TaxID=1578198 RepID=A0A417YN63_9BACI|nr:GGDEF domain-containing protein [Neobacillus notoginsengisoli]RHW34850.1 GGDEF domain-containing protein [Neobacillus notoginsengisoli]
MAKQYKSLTSLKRAIYLWVIPCILVSLLLNNFLQNNANEDFFISSILNTVLMAWFSVSWFMIFMNSKIRFIEISNLFLVSLYHIITFYDAVYSVILKGHDSLGDFIIWMPIFMAYIFITLKNRQGLLFSLMLVAITLIPGILNFGKFSAEQIDSFTQFYLANIVYIVALYFARHLLEVYSELAVAKRDAYIDSLTGIANRHQIDKWLGHYIEKSESGKGSFSVAFFDIDHFKTVNDLHGHQVGDAVLKELVKLIKSELNREELFGRWGGEEFIVIIKKPEEAAVELAERLRKRMESHHFPIAGKVTSSFGVAGFQKGDTIITLLDRADKALYLSKHAGRNKVERT